MICREWEGSGTRVRNIGSGDGWWRRKGNGSVTEEQGEKIDDR